MLKSMKFEKSFRCFKEGETIDFNKNLTVLVGEQGVGKSTILRALGDKYFRQQWKVILDVVGKMDLIYFDSEKMNPRVKSHIETEAQVAMLFSSHGESILPIVLHMEQVEGKLVLLDEPESGLSIRNQALVGKAILSASKKNQVIVSTHSSVIISMMPEVFDVSRRLWIGSQSWIKSSLEGI